MALNSEIVVKVLYLVLFFLLGALLSFFIEKVDSGKVTGYSVNSPSSPSNMIQNKDIIVYPDRVVINVQGAVVNNYDSSDSMSPVFGKEANGISVKPSSERDINVGDIITFKRGDELIVHRVVEKRADGRGVYFVTKGDGNDFSDGKIRFEDIEYKLVAVVY